MQRCPPHRGGLAARGALLGSGGSGRRHTPPGNSQHPRGQRHPSIGAGSRAGELPLGPAGAMAKGRSAGGRGDTLPGRSGRPPTPPASPLPHQTPSPLPPPNTQPLQGFTFTMGFNAGGVPPTPPLPPSPETVTRAQAGRRRLRVAAWQGGRCPPAPFPPAPCDSAGHSTPHTRTKSAETALPEKNKRAEVGEERAMIQPFADTSRFFPVPPGGWCAPPPPATPSGAWRGRQPIPRQGPCS